ncbi:hypothetical protein ACP26L_25505 [Paenibacillus sp. S-38]|uniref:hypothetical protein n=1 Tax=Paenibacillus sp. S-38 TaxID=3416710 RepID=UPI003CEBA23D
MIEFIDMMLLLLYTVTLSSSIYIISAHRKYFLERFKKGVVSAFLLAMLFFLSAYTVKMLVAVWIRASEVFGFRNPDIEEWQLLAWLLAQVGTTAGLVILAVMTYKNKFDLFICLRKIDKKGEQP